MADLDIKRQSDQYKINAWFQLKALFVYRLGQKWQKRNKTQAFMRGNTVI